MKHKEQNVSFLIQITQIVLKKNIFFVYQKALIQTFHISFLTTKQPL